MRKKVYLLLGLLLVVVGCTEVIKLDLKDGVQRLVIDGNILVNRDTQDVTSSVKLSLSQSFYDSTSKVQYINDASVNLINNITGEMYEFVSGILAGSYIYDFQDFDRDASYTLIVDYEGEHYKSVPEKLITTPNIDRIETTKSNGGFGGDNVFVTHQIYFQDDPNEENYYIIISEKEGEKEKTFPDFDFQDDRLFNGKEFNFSVFEAYEKSREITTRFNFQAVNQRQWIYLKLIGSAATNATSGGGPFSTPSANVRGNIVNKTNETHYPFGYFSIVEFENEIIKKIY